MKAVLLAVAAALTGLTCAQLGKLPDCAGPCVTQYTSGSEIAGCSGIDIACICSNSNFLTGIACCVVDKCSAADQKSTTDFAHQLCESNGVDNLPASASCASSASSTSTESASTPVDTTASTATTSSATGGSSETSSTSSKAAIATGSTASSSSSASSATPTSGARHVARHNAGAVGLVGVLGGIAVAALL